MRSSGIKRGLATTAMAALAVTGIPALASATTVAEQVGAGKVVLYSQFNSGNEASPKYDGADSTIRLAAGAGSDVSAVTFEYALPGGDFVVITTVSTRNDDGLFAYDWAPGPALLGVAVNLRVTAAGTPTVFDRQDSVDILRPDGAEHAVNLDQRGEVGVFQQPNYATGQNRHLVVVTGKTSATTGTVSVSRLDDTGAPQGPSSAPVTAAEGATTGTFRTLLNISGYPYDTTASPVDQLVVGAERDTDDVEGYTLYKQEITTVTASPADTRVPSGDTTTVTVTVRDQKGVPIPGAQVFPSTYDMVSGPITDQPTYTDADGRATFEQGSGTVFYYANTTSARHYEADIDKRSADVTVNGYTPMATTLEGRSADGSAFDVDEHSSGDITVQVKDQEGDDLSAPLRQVNYHWVITPFDGSPASVRYPASGNETAITDQDGRATVPLPAGQESGVYELHAGLAADSNGNGAIPTRKVLTVKAGEAAVAYEQGSPEQAIAGTSEVVGGKLALEDGTGLPTRQIALTFQRGTESGEGADAAGDAGFDNGAAATGTGRTVTTGNDGRFSVTVKDPVETPQPEEKGGNIDAAPAGNTDAAKNDHGVDFLRSIAAGKVDVAPEIALSPDGKTPGRPVSSQVAVTSADGSPLANQVVTLTTDRGFFTPYAATFNDLEPAQPAAGQDAGAYRNLGAQRTVTTDADGIARFTVAIERDPGFDDDGKAVSTVRAVVGALSDTEQVDWTSSNPYNGGEVRLELARAARQESGVPPKAPTSDKVLLDVFTEDQFGNLVGGEPVQVAEGSETAQVAPAGVTSDFDTDGDVTLSASAAGDVVTTATWQTETHRYLTANPPAITTGTETLTGSRTVSYYEVDFARSTFDLTHSGADSKPVGSAVTSTYTAKDQHGEPIADLWVRIFRSGPDGSDSTDGELLGQDGKVDYVFQGGAAGTAVLTAVGRDGGASGPVVEEAERVDRVSFTGGTQPSPVAIEALLKGFNTGAGRDKLTVTVPRAAEGAKARLFRVERNGKRVLVRIGNINERGKESWVVADRNGRRITTYVVVVGRTEATRADRSNTKKIR